MSKSEYVHDLAIPTVHLNGTARDELEDQLARAVRAISEAQQALKLAFPNARDYYVQADPNAAAIARTQASMRAKKLNQIEDELMDIYRGIVAQ